MAPLVSVFQFAMIPTTLLRTHARTGKNKQANPRTDRSPHLISITVSPLAPSSLESHGFVFSPLPPPRLPDYEDCSSAGVNNVARRPSSIDAHNCFDTMRCDPMTLNWLLFPHIIPPYHRRHHHHSS
eukprot:GHVU01082741.1.p1 GENE.GHVU01082741.1~~GHVU01082741.1.p1  ORF type:complete len:127 (+),score=10.59 GHVU01082741.1:159-539(+)